MHAARSTLLLLLILLGGCLGTPAAPDSSVEGATPPFEDGRLFFLEDCEGPRVAYDWFGPAGPNGPGTPPPGWELEAGSEAFVVDLMMLACDHVGWGPIERGPVHVGLESHTSFDPPASCREGLPQPTLVRILERFWFDDPDVAAYAATRSAAVTVMTAQVEHEEAPIEMSAFQWAAPDGPTSTIEAVQGGSEPSDTVPEDVAFYWFNGTSVHRLLLHKAAKLAATDVLVADVHEPSMLGDRPAPQPVRGSWYTELDQAGSLAVFADLECRVQVFP